MKSLLFSYKTFEKRLKLIILLLIISPAFLKAQTSKVSKHTNKPVVVRSISRISYSGNDLKTAGTATCPVSNGINAFTLVGQDTATGSATFNSGHNFGCNPVPFYLFPQAGANGAIPSTCVSTNFADYSNSLGANGTEAVYAGGVPIYTICPTCATPIGGGTAFGGQVWDFELYNLDSTQDMKFVFCSLGAITTTTITLVDCWAGNPLPSTPSSLVYSGGATCDTLTLAPNTNIGLGVYTIAPATASTVVTDFGGGGALIDANLLGAGTYTVTYNFTPPASSGCTTVTKTFKFTIGATPTISVNASPSTICAGGTTTLAASGGTTYTWSPSSGLSSVHAATVTATPTVTTLYVVTATSGSCTASDTVRVTVAPTGTFAVNFPTTICSGSSINLIASNTALTYTWAPVASTTVSATTDTALINPSSTTVYTVTGANGSCAPLTITDTIKVNVSPTIVVLSPTVCVGTTATISATGATSYTWTPVTTSTLTASVTNDTAYVITPTVSANYTVMGTDSINGCVGTAVSNVVVSNHLGILSGSPESFCYGTGGYLGAVGASTYTWTASSPTCTLTNSNASGSLVYVSPATPTGTYTLTINGLSTSGTTCTGDTTVMLSINPTPTVTAADTSNAICAGSSVSLTVTAVPNGTYTAAFTWTPTVGLSVATGSVVTASPTVTTVYTATGTYSTGCSSSVQYTVFVNPIGVTVNSPAICAGDTTTLTALPTTTVSGATTTYSWTGGTTANTLTVSPTTSTSYTVIQFNTYINTTPVLTCSNTATSTVTVNSLPSLIVSSNTTICIGSTDTLKVSGLGASSYLWMPSTLPATGGTVVASPTVSTTYSVIGTNTLTGCVNTATTNVTVSTPPTFSISSIPTTSLCAGSSVSLSITPTSTVAPTIPYTWTCSANGGLSGSVTGVNITDTPTGTGTVVYTAATASGGCPFISSATVTVNPNPILSPGYTLSTCSFWIYSLYTYPPLGSNYTYTWSPSSLNTSGVGADTASISNIYSISTPSLNIQNYSVVAQNSFGCTTSETYTVYVNPIPVVTASISVNPVCEGGTINLLGTSTPSTSVSYLWTGPSTYTSSTLNPVITNANSITEQGIYTFVASYTTGCTSQPQSVTVSITPTQTLNPIVPGTICPGQTWTYTPTGTAGIISYDWTPSTGLTLNTNGSVAVATSNTTTAFSVVGFDGTCPTNTVMAVLNVVPIQPTFVASPDSGAATLNVVFTNNSIGANATYTWNYGNGSVTYTTTNAIDPATHTTYSIAGIYTVTLMETVTSGTLTCSLPYNLPIIVVDNYTITIPNIFTPNGDGINDEYMVKSEGVTSMSIDIFDRWGLKMFSSSTINAPWDGKNMGGKEVPDDTYFYIINATSNKGVTNKYKGYITLLR